MNRLRWITGLCMVMMLVHSGGLVSPVAAAVLPDAFPACTNAAGVGVVANNGEGTVSFLNLELNQECDIVDLGTASPSGPPVGAALTPDGRTAVVSGGRRVTFFDVTVDPPALTGVVEVPAPPSPPGGPALGGVCLSPDGRFAVTVGSNTFGSAAVQSIDIAAQAAVTSLFLGGATACAVSDQTLAQGFFTVLVSGQSRSFFRVLQLDATDGTLTDGGIVARNPGSGLMNIALSPRGRRLALTANQDSNDVTVLTLEATGEVIVVGTVALGAGTRPLGVAIAPNGETAWVITQVPPPPGPPPTGPASTVAKLAIDAADRVTDTGLRLPIPGGTPGFTGTLGGPGLAVDATSTEALVVSGPSSGPNRLQKLDAVNNRFTGEAILVGLRPAQVSLPAGLPSAAAQAE
jgi:DNA-binding beta-propeller fold protein YncE